MRALIKLARGMLGHGGVWPASGAGLFRPSLGGARSSGLGVLLWLRCGPFFPWLAVHCTGAVWPPTSLATSTAEDICLWEAGFFGVRRKSKLVEIAVNLLNLAENLTQ